MVQRYEQTRKLQWYKRGAAYIFVYLNGYHFWLEHFIDFISSANVRGSVTSCFSSFTIICAIILFFICYFLGAKVLRFPHLGNTTWGVKRLPYRE